MDNNLKNFLQSIGITPVPQMYDPVFEELFIKFMSEAGAYDEIQADQFEEWLKLNNFNYERLDQDEKPSRRFKLSSLAAAKVYELTLLHDNFDEEVCVEKLREMGFNVLKLKEKNPPSDPILCKVYDIVWDTLVCVDDIEVTIKDNDLIVTINSTYGNMIENSTLQRILDQLHCENIVSIEIQTMWVGIKNEKLAVWCVYK